MPSLFLINPISGRGHLDAYARLFCRALVEIGFDVVLIAERDGGTYEYLTRLAPSDANRFTFISSEQADDWAEETLRDRVEASDIPAPIRKTPLVSINYIFGSFCRQLALHIHEALKHICPKKIQPFVITLLSRLLGRRFGGVEFEPLVRRVKVAAERLAIQPELIFFLYLDLMAENKDSLSAVEKLCLPCAGIIFSPRALSNYGHHEKYLYMSAFQGALFLVPEAVKTYQKIFPDRYFSIAPDVADTELIANGSSLKNDIRERAGDRIVILQIGSILPHKGILCLLDVIHLADPSRFFFALVGEVYWDSFGAYADQLRSFYSSPPENVFVYNGYITDERDYNNVIHASDVIYAVYSNFLSSSNSLTKAAGLERPILVSDRSLMGERVLKHHIGAVAPEQDPVQILAKLEMLAATPRNEFNFHDFMKSHSLECLKNVLTVAVPIWIENAQQKFSRPKR